MTADEIVDGLKERTSIGESDDIDYVIYHEASDVIFRVFKVIASVLIVTIVILVPLIISLEVVYICFPFIREPIDKLNVKIEGNGITRHLLGLTLHDAVSAVELADTSNTGESALRIYLINKIKSQMFLAFILSLALMGGPTIVGFVWRLFKGVFDVIGIPYS